MEYLAKKPVIFSILDLLIKNTPQNKPGFVVFLFLWMLDFLLQTSPPCTHIMVLTFLAQIEPSWVASEWLNADKSI